MTVAYLLSRARAGVQALLPRGGALPEHSWTARHRGVCALLWAHAAVLVPIGLSRGHPVVTTFVETAIVVAFASAALVPSLSRTARSTLATLGLLSCSASLVHFFDGLIEIHFHFFVMIAVVALYQAWRPYLVALAFVLLHHSVLGTLEPHLVYNHASAVHDPALFALVHGGFIFAESVACLVYWKVTEAALDGERSARSELDSAHADLSKAQELAGMGSWEWDLGTRVVAWSDQQYALAGRTRSTFTPELESFLEMVHPDDATRVGDKVRASVASGARLDDEFRLVRPDGSIRQVHVLGEAAVDAGGVVTRLFGTTHDVTERRRLQAEIEHLAFHDPLTGLANRRLFLDRLGHALAMTSRSGRPCAVLFIDLDGFKSVNDTFGHPAGDELLCEVARRLTSAARAVDTVARFGGDEFALLCIDIDIAAAQLVADRITEHLYQPVELQGTTISLRGSIGIAVATPGRSPEDILRDADVAMYAAKIAGRGTDRGAQSAISVPAVVG